MWNYTGMDSVRLNDELAAAVACVTPRRVELLLAALAQPGSFTVSDLREVTPTDGGSLPRDVRALEHGGWLRGDPPESSGRQGRTVAYTVTPLAIDLFPELARLVETAISSRPPARDDAPDA